MIVSNEGQGLLRPCEVYRAGVGASKEPPGYPITCR